MTLILSLKKLVEEYKGQFTCLGKKCSKIHIFFSVPIKKEVKRIYKLEKKLQKPNQNVRLQIKSY